MSNEPVNQKEAINSDEKRYEAKSSVSFFGAPIAWVALFGALIGALSIVPMLFYVTGGGFMSVGMGIFAPIAGIMLGPWAGFAAGTIGGVIGMMISPASYPLGFVDVLLSGSFMPLAWGLLQPKYRKLVLLLYPILTLGLWLVPYYLPGSAGGFSKALEPQYLISTNYGWVGLLLFLFGAPMIWKLLESENKQKAIVGLALNSFMACVLWAMPWFYLYYWLLRFPVEELMLMNTLAWINPTIPVVLAGTPIAYFLLRAMLKGNLRVVPNSWLSGFHFRFPF